MSTSGWMPPPPGWYPDPSGESYWRWWDGTRWTNQTAPTIPERDPWYAAPGIARGLQAADGIAAVVAAGIVLFDLVSRRPVPGVSLMLIGAVPLVGVGQIWSILVINSCTAQSSSTSNCVTTSSPAQAADVQRFAGGILFGFFIFHCGVATGEVARRRPPTPNPGPSEPGPSPIGPWT